MGISGFILFLFLGGAAGTARLDSTQIAFDSMKLCESERTRLESYFYKQGFTNVKGICIQTREQGK